MTWDRQVALHFDTSTTVNFGSKPFSSRRGCHTGQPESVMRLNILIPHLHPILVNFLDMDTLDNLLTLCFQFLRHFLSEFWSKRCKTRSGPCTSTRRASPGPIRWK